MQTLQLLLGSFISKTVYLPHCGILCNPWRAEVEKSFQPCSIVFSKWEYGIWVRLGEMVEGSGLVEPVECFS